jgi:hypothetical protein
LGKVAGRQRDLGGREDGLRRGQGVVVRAVFSARARLPQDLQRGVQRLPDLRPADDPRVEELGALLVDVAAGPRLRRRPLVAAQRPVDVLVQRARVAAAMAMAQRRSRRAAGEDALGQAQRRRVAGARGGIGGASGIRRVGARGTGEAAALPSASSACALHRRGEEEVAHHDVAAFV